MALNLPQYRNTSALPEPRTPLAPASVAAGAVAPTTSNKKGMRDISLTLDGINSQTINAQGDYFHIQSVSVTGASIYLRFDDGPQITRQQGQGNRVYYSKIEISASTACKVTVQVGYGYATDARSSISGTVTAEISPSGSVNDTAPLVTVTGQHALFAANVSRSRITVFADATNTASVFVRKSGGANNIGILPPGSVTEFAGTYALDYNDTSTGGQKFYVFEEQP